MVSITSASSERGVVVDYFKRTRLIPLRIERIQNSYQWHNYQQTLDKFLFRKETPNERTLSHGTRKENPETIISSRDGVDFRLSNQGVWGFSTYLAEDVRLSNIYAYEVPNSNLKSILLVQALLGNVVHLKENESLILPPLIPIDVVSGFSSRYDSISDTLPSGHF